MSHIMCNGSTLNDIKQPTTSLSGLSGLTSRMYKPKLQHRGFRWMTHTAVRKRLTVRNKTITNGKKYLEGSRGHVHAWIMVRCCFQTAQFVAACCFLSSVTGSFFSSSVTSWRRIGKFFRGGKDIFMPDPDG